MIASANSLATVLLCCWLVNAIFARLRCRWCQSSFNAGFCVEFLAVPFCILSFAFAWAWVFVYDCFIGLRLAELVSVSVPRRCRRHCIELNTPMNKPFDFGSQNLANPEFFGDRTVLVTGALGTVGQLLVKQLAQLDVKRVVAVDNRETELHEYSLRGDAPCIKYHFGDVRDPVRMAQLLEGVDYVFHLAAVKHVPIAEQSPHDAVSTNVEATQQLIRLTREAGTKLLMFTSSDKAVSPTNVLGASKLLGERILSASQMGSIKTRFASTRFGNVLGSRGSVLPLFADQIRRGGPVTLTDPDMTRFVMTVDRAAELVINSSPACLGGDIWVTKMPVINIRDLAQTMIELLAPLYGFRAGQIEIKAVGARPGEKVYEELMTVEEARIAWETDEYFIVPYHHLQHQIYSGARRVTATHGYDSSKVRALTQPQLADYLLENGLLNEWLNPHQARQAVL